SASSPGAVASRAVVGVERGELQHLVRRAGLRALAWRARRGAAAREQGQAQSGDGTEIRRSVHGRSSAPCRGAISPGASTPARRANERFSEVGRRVWRSTTRPATTPNATCDAPNQTQSIWLCSSGLIRPRIEY